MQSLARNYNLFSVATFDIAYLDKTLLTQMAPPNFEDLYQTFLKKKCKEPSQNTFDPYDYQPFARDKGNWTSGQSDLETTCSKTRSSHAKSVYKILAVGNHLFAYIGSSIKINYPITVLGPKNNYSRQSPQ